MYVSYTLLDGGGFPLVTYRNPTEAMRMLVMARAGNMPITLQQQVHRTLNDYSPEELKQQWETWQDYLSTSHTWSAWEEGMAEGYSDEMSEVSKRYTELTGRSIVDDSIVEE